MIMDLDFERNEEYLFKEFTCMMRKSYTEG